jgi:hypothetical protein
MGGWGFGYDTLNRFAVQQRNDRLVCGLANKPIKKGNLGWWRYFGNKSACQDRLLTLTCARRLPYLRPQRGKAIHA